MDEPGSEAAPAPAPPPAQDPAHQRSVGHPLVSAYWYWVVAIVACLLVRFVELASTNHRALALAVLLLGIVILGQLFLDLIWGNLGSEKSTESRQQVTAATYTKGFGQAASTLIGVPGVVLGLLAVFGKPPFPLGLKVGAASLVFSLVLSIMLLFFSSLGVPSDKGPLVFLGYIVNVIFWSLSLGLLCIVAVLILANGASGGG
jgi:hypothetical protein